MWTAGQSEEGKLLFKFIRCTLVLWTSPYLLGYVCEFILQPATFFFSFDITHSLVQIFQEIKQKWNPSMFVCSHISLTSSELFKTTVSG